jgi:hypothetical protein
MSRIIRLPRTATRRNAPSFAWLLERVDPAAVTALDFYGRMMTPGAIVDESELWPTATYPAVPVLLETCQLIFTGRGHHKNPLEHILWIYSVRTREWRQIAHVSAHHAEEWIPPIAAVAAKYCNPRIKPPEPDLHQAARRIAAVIESELVQLQDNRQRRELLQVAVDYLAFRHADIGSTARLYQMPLSAAAVGMLDELQYGSNPLDRGWSLRDRMSEGEGIPRLGM